MRPTIRAMLSGSIARALRGRVAAAGAQLDPLDPRRDAIESEVVRDSVTDAR